MDLFKLELLAQEIRALARCLSQTSNPAVLHQLYKEIRYRIVAAEGELQ